VRRPHEPLALVSPSLAENCRKPRPSYRHAPPSMVPIQMLPSRSSPIEKTRCSDRSRFTVAEDVSGAPMRSSASPVPASGARPKVASPSTTTTPTPLLPIHRRPRLSSNTQRTCGMPSPSRRPIRAPSMVVNDAPSKPKTAL